jgi:protein SCO1/2
MKEIVILFAVGIIVSGCGNNFDLDQNVTGKRLKLFNQDSVEVKYPDVIKDKVVVIGFIYTHCPDICPMTTHNIQLAEEKLSKDELKGVKFLLVSFDPERDSPSILKKYAFVRDMNMNDWELLTGSIENIDPLLNEFNVRAIHDDTTYNDKGEPDYFIIHTDRISLVDENGNLRKNYRGSIANPDEIANDIKKLL